MNAKLQMHNSVSNLINIRGAIFSNALNMFSTLILQVALTSFIGISDDLGRFYLFITITVIVTSVVTGAFQNVYLGSLVRNETIRVEVLRKFLWIAGIAFLLQQIFSGIYLFVQNDFDMSKGTSLETIGLIVLAACYSLFQMIATLLNHVLIGLKRYKSASYLPIIPSTLAALSVVYSPSFRVAIFSLTIGSALQVLMSGYLMRNISLDLRFYSAKQLQLPSISTYFLTTLQYVFINVATILQRSLMAANSLSAFSLFSVAEKNVATESTLATRGFNQVTIAEVMRLENDLKIQTNKLLELLRMLTTILILMSIAFYLLASPFLNLIFLRGQFSVVNLQDCIEMMKTMQVYICVEAIIVLYSNFLFNIKRFIAATSLSCMSSLTLICFLLLNRHYLTPYTLIQMLTVNSGFWLFVRVVYVNRLLQIRMRQLITLIILLVLSLFIPILDFFRSILL